MESSRSRFTVTLVREVPSEDSPKTPHERKGDVEGNAARPGREEPLCRKAPSDVEVERYQAKFEALIEKWEQNVKLYEAEMPQMVKDEIQMTVDKTRRVINTTFKEFLACWSRACTRGYDSAMTAEDLAGFWRRIITDVNDTEMDFSWLDLCKEKGWALWTCGRHLPPKRRWCVLHPNGGCPKRPDTPPPSQPSAQDSVAATATPSTSAQGSASQSNAMIDSAKKPKTSGRFRRAGRFLGHLKNIVWGKKYNPEE